MIPQVHVLASRLSQVFESDERPLTALDGLDLTVYEGEFVSIIGPSGCGKTTLLKVIGGLLEPTSGVMEIAGKSPRHAQEFKQVGFVFQESSLLPWRNVLDNVMLPLSVGSTRGSRAGGIEDAERTVRSVGLEEFARYYPHQLSGGMRQRVALARALVFNPSLLLMDEPLGSLDEITRAAMRYEVLRLWETTGTSVVMVTHSIPEAVGLSDRVVVMSGLPGRVRGTVQIDIPRPRNEAMERTGAFLDCVDAVKRLLGEGGAVGAATGARAIV